MHKIGIIICFSFCFAFLMLLQKHGAITILFSHQLPNLGRGEGSPEEFPWSCLILDGKNNFVGSCAIIPERSDNDISQGTRKVITAAHKLKNVGPRE
jgi:hypothetical protein